MSELHFWTAFAFVLGIVAGVLLLAICNAMDEGGRCFHCDGSGHRSGDGCPHCDEPGRAGHEVAP